jgi:hypothetical protein
MTTVGAPDIDKMNAKRRQTRRASAESAAGVARMPNRPTDLLDAAAGFGRV